MKAEEQEQSKNKREPEQNSPKYKCSKCQDTGKWYCGGLVIKDGNSFRCCDCLKYTDDKTAISFHHCMREKACSNCS